MAVGRWPICVPVCSVQEADSPGTVGEGSCSIGRCTALQVRDGGDPPNGCVLRFARPDTVSVFLYVAAERPLTDWKCNCYHN